MEVINFKTAYSVHDQVYILVGGKIRFGRITAVAFCGDGYAYDVETGASYSLTAKTTSRYKESEIRTSLDDAINYAVEVYRKGLYGDWGFDVQDDGTVRPRQKQTTIVDWSNGFQGDGEDVKTKLDKKK